jgi:eukaryotic-like serine/threonine-protein kinase
MNDAPQKIISFEEFDLDTERRILRRDGEHLALKAKTFDLLAFLVKNSGRVISKDEILKTVWAGQFVEEANLSVQISALRKALGEKKDAPRFLITVPGVGYKFVADVQNGEVAIEKNQFSRSVVVEEIETEKGIKAEAEKKPVSSEMSLSSFLSFSLSQKKLAFAGIAAFLIVSAVVFWLFNRKADNQSAVSVAASERQPKIKRLTNHGRAGTGALSPDGKFFAYSYVEKGSPRNDLRLAQTDGGGETVLVPLAETDFYPKTFSADGSWLYYTASEPRETTGALYKMPVLRGVPQKLADGVSIWLAVSPDEKQIAFIRNSREENTSSLVVADLNGARERVLAVRPAENYFVPDSPAWSADGQFIALSAANGTSRKDASKKSFEVFIVRAADGRLEQLTSLDWNALDSFEWLKDGSGLLAVAQNAERIFEYQLWQIDYPDGKARLFSRDAHTYGAKMSLSADSKSLLVIQREVETNIWLAPANNLKQARQITFSSSGRADGWYGMNFAPDGRIVYTAWIDQSLTIWTMDALGANPKQLTSIGFRDEKPMVSADGRFIVFQSNRSGATEIWRMETDGGNLRQLTNGGGNSNPSVTPDGKWVVYRKAKNGTNSIWRVPTTGGAEMRITNEESFLPRVSPDGKFVACAYAHDGKTKLAVVPIEGGAPIKSFDVPKTRNFRYDLRWSPDGKFISYPDEVNGIWQQPLNGGKPVRLKDVPQEKTFSFDWSPNGKNFAFGRVREVRDVMLISDFR